MGESESPLPGDARSQVGKECGRFGMALRQFSDAAVKAPWVFSAGAMRPCAPAPLGASDALKDMQGIGRWRARGLPIENPALVFNKPLFRKQKARQVTRPGAKNHVGHFFS
jgi:hypothetical protein